jgi:hypothetical protein
MKIFSLDETITQLENLWEWVEQERELKELNEDEIATLYSALVYLYKVQKIK